MLYFFDDAFDDA